MCAQPFSIPRARGKHAFMFGCQRSGLGDGSPGFVREGFPFAEGSVLVDGVDPSHELQAQHTHGRNRGDGLRKVSAEGVADGLLAGRHADLRARCISAFFSCMNGVMA